MANYREENIDGTKWQRCFKIEAVNNVGEIPHITFFEEEVVQFGGETIKKQNGHMQLQFSDPAKTFPLLNPQNDTEIGTASHAQVYALLYSLYRATAYERDNPPEEQPAGE